jgi:multisubunit Na+/H+ antiporter MnhF subunit
VPCLIGCCEGSPLRRLVALQLAGTIAALLIMMLAQGFSRPSYMDVAITMGLLSLMGTFAYARLLERWF